jgi:hypothetical protein
MKRGLVICVLVGMVDRAAVNDVLKEQSAVSIKFLA